MGRFLNPEAHLGMKPSQANRDYSMQIFRFCKRTFHIAALTALCMAIYWVYPIHFGLTGLPSLSSNESRIHLEIQEERISEPQNSQTRYETRLIILDPGNEQTLQNYFKIDEIAIHKLPLILDDSICEAAINSINANGLASSVAAPRITITFDNHNKMIFDWYDRDAQRQVWNNAIHAFSEDISSAQQQTMNLEKHEPTNRIAGHITYLNREIFISHSDFPFIEQYGRRFPNKTLSFSTTLPFEEQKQFVWFYKTVSMFPKPSSAYLILFVKRSNIISKILNEGDISDDPRQ